MYDVTFIVDAVTVPIRVEAANDAEAEAKANQQVHTGLCWHCSERLDIGDIQDVIVTEVTE